MTMLEIRWAGTFARSPSGTEPLQGTTYVRSISGYRTPTFTGKCLASDHHIAPAAHVPSTWVN